MHGFQMVWSSACRVIIDRIASLGSVTVGATFPEPEQGVEWKNAVESLVTTMSLFAIVCPLMSRLFLFLIRLSMTGEGCDPDILFFRADMQLAKVRQAYAVI